MWRTKDELLCHMKAGAMIVARLLTIPGVLVYTQICTFLTEDEIITHLNSAQVLSKNLFSSFIDASINGNFRKDLDLHSIWSGGTMTMFYMEFLL